MLTNHKDGWVASFTSFVPTRVYYSPDFQVNIVGKQVVVSYKTDDGYPQFVKLIKYDWSSVCAKVQLTSKSTNGLKKLGSARTSLF
ncbi:hypothetical protein [Shewanella spartinae]|uniref:hypothetical protein n=1 Tax=Shewanella spartinae TaxID=2864205 RepID=UPI001C65DAA5|nr:hypothetical protein [Shewanella spartinae]QYJ95607.1 hypothetical protein K0I31_09735 [Shewanella spartinae]